MINKYTFTGKTYEEAVLEAELNLNKKKDELIIKEKDTKKGLFNKKEEIEVIDKKDVIDYIKEKTQEIITNMGLNPKIEVKNKDNMYVFGIYSENNAILIGKNGKSIDAIQTLLRQIVFNEIGENFNFSIDVGEYKRRNQIRLEKLAKLTAKEVAQTKVEVKLDSMNSYERRIIHNTLNNSKDVCTESIGEEPNRCVVIKLKENN